MKKVYNLEARSERNRILLNRPKYFHFKIITKAFDMLVVVFFNIFYLCRRCKVVQSLREFPVLCNHLRQLL